MIVAAIHQPHYLPWPGYFYKMAHADVFILLDSVQPSLGRGYKSRNKIKTSNGAKWLTVPCLKKRDSPAICDIRIDNSSNWRKKHLETIRHSYSKSPFFSDCNNLLGLVYETEWDMLADLDLGFISLLKEMIGINTTIVRSSLLNVKGSNTDLLINICKEMGADVYLSGIGGANYQEEQKFKNAGIQLTYSNFTYPNYDQLWGDFIPNLSVLDMLFNCGSEIINFIGGGHG